MAGLPAGSGAVRAGGSRVDKAAASVPLPALGAEMNGMAYGAVVAVGVWLMRPPPAVREAA